MPALLLQLSGLHLVNRIGYNHNKNCDNNLLEHLTCSFIDTVQAFIDTAVSDVSHQAAMFLRSLQQAVLSLLHSGRLGQKLLQCLVQFPLRLLYSQVVALLVDI